MLASPGIRPLTVGAGVIRGMLVVLLAKIDDIIDEVSTVVLAEEAANVAEEVVVLSEVTAMSTLSKMAVSMPGALTVGFADDLRKQSIPLVALG